MFTENKDIHISGILHNQTEQLYTQPRKISFKARLECKGLLFYNLKCIIYRSKTHMYLLGYIIHVIPILIKLFFYFFLQKEQLLYLANSA